jgi:putative glutamine amidotransferase
MSYKLLVISILFSQYLFSQSSYKRIGLVNPTVKNLKKLDYIISTELIDIDSVNVIGVFHESQIEEIDLSQKFIDSLHLSGYRIEILKGSISQENIFSNNDYTKQFEAYFKQSDAMLFFGGPDIPPVVYGEKMNLTTSTYPFERVWEISFLCHLIENDSFNGFLKDRKDYVVLGICLGMQEMNVSNGGTLYQDIPSEIYGLHNIESILEMPIDEQHRNYLGKIYPKFNDSAGIVFHEIYFDSNSYLNQFIFKNPNVASIHHQSIHKLGKDFKISALSIDGKIIEAIESTLYKNVYGVQFHPEISELYDPNITFVTPNNFNFKLNENSLNFHKLFWANFSERLKNQKL